MLDDVRNLPIGVVDDAEIRERAIGAGAVREDIRVEADGDQSRVSGRNRADMLELTGIDRAADGRQRRRWRGVLALRSRTRLAPRGVGDGVDVNLFARRLEVVAR